MTAGSATTAPEAKPRSSGSALTVRDRRFSLSDVPRHWHPAGRAVSLFFDNFSLFFPVAERFFITTVKALRTRAPSAQLAADADAFCTQEGHHSREHFRYNERLKAYGYPVEAHEERLERAVARARARLTPREQLAITCAFEHFTSVMASALLQDPRYLGEAHPEMAALWRWHAAEEVEHRSVAFDLFEAAGGTYWERCRLMFASTVFIWARVFSHQVSLMRTDGLHRSAKEWSSLLRFLFFEPGVLRRLGAPYLRYFRPAFHPSEG